MLVAPRRQIRTFGTTCFRFQLLTEPMDRAGEVRLREGTVEAERPQLLTPEHFARLLLEGFDDERAQGFADWLAQQGGSRTLGAGFRSPGAGPVALRYGFTVRRSQVSETLFRGEELEAVAERLCAEAEADEDALRTVLQGVDDAWEVCLLKLTVDLVNSSGGQNLDDLRGRGML